VYVKRGTRNKRRSSRARSKMSKSRCRSRLIRFLQCRLTSSAFPEHSSIKARVAAASTDPEQKRRPLGSTL